MRLNRLGVATLCIVFGAGLPAAAARADIIYSEDFESGTASGFAFTGTPFWHVTQNAPAAGSFALGFVQNETASATPDGDFATGSTVNGTAFGPAIDLTNVIGAITLTFDALDHGEGSTIFDGLTVGVSSDGSSFGTILASTFAGDIPIDSGYNPITLDLSAFAGQTIFLAFNFDSIDGIANNFPGARIDNIQLNGTLATPEPTSLAFFALGGLGAFGVYRRRRAKSRK